MPHTASGRPQPEVRTGSQAISSSLAVDDVQRHLFLLAPDPALQAPCARPLLVSPGVAWSGDAAPLMQAGRACYHEP